MKIQNVTISVAKYKGYRYYQNPEVLSEMSKTRALIFNANSAAHLHVTVLHHLTCKVVSEKQYH